MMGEYPKVASLSQTGLKQSQREQDQKKAMTVKHDVENEHTKYKSTQHLCIIYT